MDVIFMVYFWFLLVVYHFLCPRWPIFYNFPDSCMPSNFCEICNAESALKILLEYLVSLYLKSNYALDIWHVMTSHSLIFCVSWSIQFSKATIKLMKSFLGNFHWFLMLTKLQNFETSIYLCIYIYRLWKYVVAF